METNQKGAKEEVDTDCPESVEDTESETTSGFCCSKAHKRIKHAVTDMRQKLVEYYLP